MATFLRLLALLIVGFASSHAVAADLTSRCVVPRGTLPFEFAVDGNVLRGFIDVPPLPGKHPAIAIVHGSGTTNVTGGDGSYNSSYDELRAAFRSAGVATVVWDKAGNGCSDGRYVHGDDVYGRANELVAGIEVLRRRADIDASHIGAWAISQGGWVAPMAAVRSRHIGFLILVSAPAGDFYSIWEYQALLALRADRIPEREAQAAVATLRHALLMAQAGASYAEFTAATQSLQKYPVFGQQLGITGGSAEAYAASQRPEIARIWPTNAKAFLAELDVPVLAIFGDHDIKVDWRDSVRVYRELSQRVGRHDLTIKVFKNASHELFAVAPDTASSAKRSDSQLVPGYLDTVTTWLRARIPHSL